MASTTTAEDSTTNNKRRFRMVALDLDGTLLNSSHDISDATIAYLRHLHAKGFVVAIATGRSAACTAHIIDKLDCLLHIPDVDDNGCMKGEQGFPLVCTNGARGLRIVRKSYSDVGHLTETKTASPHRRNTAPINAIQQQSSSSSAGPPSNPFLKKTLIINEELFHDPLPKELTLKTLALASKLGCATNYYHNHHIYAVARNEEQLDLTKRYAKLTGSTELYHYLNKEQEVHNEENGYGYQKAMELGPPSKLLILCNTDKLDDTTALVREELNGTDDATQPPQANVIRGTPPFFVEILSPTVHKGHGLVQLCKTLSIPLDEVVAFGDGDNDLEFIQMAGWGVAMKNGRVNVKESADEVSEWSNDEDGVIKMLGRYEEEGRLIFP